MTLAVQPAAPSTEPAGPTLPGCAVEQGCTMARHAHDCEPLLSVTSCSGMVATELDPRELNIGDVIHIKTR